uniref:Uncharacterized protein n=1 Tax=Arundo donax TaxID=35708 RepID=A0A0A9F8X0_ARUDO
MSALLLFPLDITTTDGAILHLHESLPFLVQKKLWSLMLSKTEMMYTTSLSRILESTRDHSRITGARRREGWLELHLGFKIIFITKILQPLKQICSSTSSLLVALGL